MSRPIAYNASGPLSGSIRGGNVNYTVDSGNRDYTSFASKKWVPSADGAAPIVFVTDTYTQGFQGNPSLAVPLFYSCNGTGSAAIIYTANRIPGSPGNYSDANVALNDLITARGYFILESNDPFEGVDADSLAFDVDASKMSSYPQTGTSWRDLSGNGNTGTLYNGPTWNSNGWFVFDGTDDYVDTSNTFQFAQSGQFSVCGLINVQDHSFRPAAAAGIIGKGHFYSNSWDIWLYNDERVFFETTGNTANVDTYYLPSDPLTVGRWYFFAATYNNTAKSLWINGVGYSNTYAGTGGFTNGNNVLIAQRAGDPSRSLIGSGSAFSIYSRELSTAEIKQNYFGAPIVTDGLVFAVDANNIVSYPKSGTAWYNLTGSVGTGTLTNGPTFNLNNGGSIVFDGADDYVNVPNGMNALVGTNQVTFSAWIRRSSTTGYWAGIISNKINATDGIALLVDPSSKIFFQYDSTSGVYAIYGGATLETNVWYNIVGIYDNVGLKTYLNGVLNDSAADAGKSIASAGNMDIVIGAHQPVSSYFPGEIANVKIYNRGLTASEVLQNYQAEQYRFAGPQGIPTNGLQLWLDAGNLDSYPGTGTTWYDLSSQGNNMTLVNGPTYNQTNGGVIIFDGIDDYAQRTLSNCSTSFKTMTEYTVISVFQSLDSTTDWNCLYSFGDTFPGNIDNWQQAGTRYFGSDNQSLYTNVDLYTAGINMWSQTFTSGDNKIYRNNTLNTSNAATTIANPSVSGGFVIANRPEDFGYPTKMNMNLMLIYNRVLTTAELTQIYNYYKGRFGI